MNPAGAATADPAWSIGARQPFIPWIPQGSRAPFEGADYGVAWIELAARTLTPDPHALRRATSGSEPENLIFVQQAALLAHHYALRNRGSEHLLANPPDAVTVERALEDAAPSPARPARLYLTNEGRSGGATERRGHYVLAIGRQTRGPVVAYELRDPNRSDPSELIFDRSTGRFQPYGPFTTVRLDDSVLPEENFGWIRRLAAALLDTSPTRRLPLWFPSRGGGQAPPEAGLAYPLASEELPEVIVALPGSNGHVDVHFDAVLTAEGADERTLWKLQLSFVERCLAGIAPFAARVAAIVTLRAVPLEDVFAAPERALGQIASVAGYARSPRTGRVYLLGETVASRAGLDAATLAGFALLEETGPPALWLEPRPEDPFGPHRVRTERLPRPRLDSPLGDALYRADRTLKQIALGLDRPTVAGFRAPADFIAEDLANSVNHLAFWLRPRRAPGLGAWTVASPDAEAVFFEESLGVFSGAREQLATFDPESPAPPDLTDRAARSLTAHLGALAAERPELAAAQSLAGMRRLVSEMRARGVTTRDLVRLDRKTGAGTRTPREAPAVGPRVLSDTGGWALGFTFITGGIRLGATVDRRDDILNGAMLPEAIALFRAEPGEERNRGSMRTMRVELPSIVPLSPDAAARLGAWLAAHAARDEFAAGRIDSALARLDAADAGTPVPEVHAWRGIIRLSQGDHLRARLDLARAVHAYPELLALQARLRAFARDTAGARADAARAASLFPERPEVLAQQAWVLLMSRQHAAAERVIRSIARLDPLLPQIEVLRDELAYQRRLGPSGAARHVREVLETPQEISRLLAEAQEAASGRRMAEAVHLAGQASAAARNHALIVSVAQPHLHLEERTAVALAGYLSTRRGPGDADSATRLLDALAARNPRAWSPWLYRIEFGERTLSPAQQIASWEEALSRARNADPFGADIEARRGIRFLDDVGYRLVQRLAGALDSDTSFHADFERLLSRLAPRLRGTPEGRMIDVWQAVLRARREGETLPSAILLRELAKSLRTVPIPRGSAGLTTFEALKSLYAYALTAPRDTRVPIPISPDSAWLEMTDRVNVAWNTPEKMRHAARLYLEATLLHCDRNLTREMHALLLRRLEYMAMRQEPLTSARAIQVLDDARDLVLRRHARGGFRRSFLVALLDGFYGRLLGPVIEPSQEPEVAALLAARAPGLIRDVASAARTEIERRATVAWIGYLSSYAPGQAAGPDAAAAIVREAFSAQARLAAELAVPPVSSARGR